LHDYYRDSFFANARKQTEPETRPANGSAKMLSVEGREEKKKQKLVISAKKYDVDKFKTCVFDL
jgi:hypothetical protein